MHSGDGAGRPRPSGRPGPAERGPGRPESIRDLQRRRREARRALDDVEAILGTPEDDEEEDEAAQPPGPAAAKVFVVFRGTRWDDPDGALRESDSIAGVYATEDGARRAAAALSKEAADRQDAWYQPYPVHA
jgi:hypothetical protein